MKKLFLVGMLLVALFFSACLSTENALKGTITTINTRGGDSYEAIEILKSGSFGVVYESAKLARSHDGYYILYMETIFHGHNEHGSVIIYVDGTKHNIANPIDWNLDDISISQYGTAYYRSITKKLDASVIEAIKNADIVSLRVVGSSYLMSGKNNMGQMESNEGADISRILPKLKEFVYK
jgi:hypothetical protein